jgi:hypothetical protein
LESNKPLVSRALNFDVYSYENPQSMGAFWCARQEVLMLLASQTLWLHIGGDGLGKEGASKAKRS